MRICSLVPAATEVLFALGLGDDVVGVTHECDWPPEVAAKPVVTASLIQTGDLTSAEIDRIVAATAWDGGPLYAIDEERWAEVKADVVVMQELCEVCAVSTDQVEGILRARPLEVEVLDFSPSTIDGISETIGSLGARLGVDGEAEELAAGMRSRLDRVASALAGVESYPRVFVTEWLEPPYSAGHWVPDMVSAAGGIDVAGTSGEPSHRMRWPDVAALEPDVVVLAPCGFDLDRTLSEVVPLDLSAHLLGTPARQESRVFAVDANAMFSRAEPARRRRRRGAGAPAPSGRVPGLRGALEPGSALGGLQADPELLADELDGVPAGGLVADEARAGGEVEAPAVVGALQHVAEHLAVHERVPLVRAGVVEGVERPVDLEDDDLAVAGVDHRTAAGEDVGTRGQHASGSRIAHAA